MYFACDNKDQNGDTYISMGKRKKGSEADRAVGQSEIMDGTGFWKDFVGVTCTYAIEYVDDIVFVPGKMQAFQVNVDVLSIFKIVNDILEKSNL